MKRLLILTALLPFVGFAQPINTLNNPNQPGYQIPSQQRMQTQMQTQQIQQKGMLNQQLKTQTGMLNQQLKTQTQLQQQHLENQINNNSQRVLQSQPGERNPARQQMLPNTNGGMLNSNRNPDSSLNQQHMLPERRNGDMLNQPSTPQPDIPLKTIGP
ncbi:DUF2756 family protein [Escherichia coli]|uniref:DUF2756 family protein n=8 Tax=Pseudomonadota TaxID=1224 RepID=UPI001DF28B1A|nr:DUF2756 family protein [Escherichia coli]EIH7715017.1 DUF2756 family protein [Escherichia coli]MBZ8368295.1 DUF2756 family protein [Escherichia coli]